MFSGLSSRLDVTTCFLSKFCHLSTVDLLNSWDYILFYSFNAILTDFGEGVKLKACVQPTECLLKFKSFIVIFPLSSPHMHPLY